MKAAAAAARTDPSEAASGRRRRWLDQVRERTREPAFWIVQAEVAAVTLLHVTVESSSMVDSHGSVWSATAHLPILLYLLPVVYAGLRYGFEGALLTGVSIAVIAAPNLLIWHRAEWSWLGEGLQMGFVVAAGAAIALPVERERRQRAHAERARQQATTVSRRLALLNDVVSTLVGSADIDAALELVLERTVEVLELEAAAAVTWRVDDGSGAIETRHVVGGHARAELERQILEFDPEQLASDGPTWVRFSVGKGRAGALVVRPGDARSLGPEELELMRGIGTQVGVAIENARMHDAERQALKDYLRGITRVQEEERRRIARELHDVATHELLLLRRDLEALVEADHGGPEGIDPVGMRQRIDEVTSWLRRFGRELRPSVLEHLGVAAGLEWLASQAEARAAAAVRFESRGKSRRLAPATELALYRIAEEGLRNAEHHARAGTITLGVTFAPDHVTLYVTDDGDGFELAGRAGSVAEGLGLIGMHERASLIGADLEIASTPGVGTRVAVRLPTSP